LLMAGRWRRAFLAVAAGALAALSLAPLHLFPVLIVSFPVLVLLIDAALIGAVSRWRAAFVVGWSFGFGYFLGGLWWVGAAFLV
ncbi:hypothetical protein J8J27_31700, partial [Mycobacterium tuberculosis]|nr:hypothetical protein [Mycobacterium tuberculosis]